MGLGKISPRLGAVLSLCFAGAGVAAPVFAHDAHVDDLLARCPTRTEVAWVAKRYKLTFVQDPTESAGLVCTSVAGSGDLTLLQLRAYQALLLLHTFEFDTPLPWAPGVPGDVPPRLGDWLRSTIRGVTFRGDVAYSSCCDPAGIVNVSATGMAALATNRWVDPRSGTGMEGLVGLIVHEARHAEVGGHTCGVDDGTPEELGAWGVQYYLVEWLASHLVDPSYLDAPAPLAPDYYRDSARDSARYLLSTRFCWLR